LTCDANNLTNVQVGAPRVDNGVVVEEDGGIDTRAADQIIAGITGFNNNGVIAIFSFSSKTENLSNFKVCALRIDGWVVSAELVS